MKMHELLAAERPAKLIPAVVAGGRLYRGRTHLDAIDQIPDSDLRRGVLQDGDNRLYVTERGRRLNRAKALQYALDHDLIADRYRSWYTPGVYGELPSEALKPEATEP